METTDETFGPIIGMKVRWWVDDKLRLSLAATSSNYGYPKENPWKDDLGLVSCKIVSCNQSSDGFSYWVSFVEGSVVGSTKEYAVISVNHRLTSIPWDYLWTEK